MQVVVLTTANLAEAKRIDEFCHAQQPPIAFIRAETRGVFASVFTDFGPDFTVIDVNGELKLPECSWVLLDVSCSSCTESVVVQLKHAFNVRCR